MTIRRGRALAKASGAKRARKMNVSKKGQRYWRGRNSLGKERQARCRGQDHTDVEITRDYACG